MALITCPECGKQISDKVVACIHCGYPIEENQSSQLTADISIHESKKNRLNHKTRNIIIIIVSFLVISLLIILFTVIIPNAIKEKNYNEALLMLEQGQYEDANALLESLSGYNETDTIKEQIKYESIAYNCINEIKQYLKNPDSYIPYEITFYLGSEATEGDKPNCIMHYGAQNGFGGNTIGYAVFAYSEEDAQYNIIGLTHTLDSEELDEDDEDYVTELFTIVTIMSLEDTGEKIGDIDLARMKQVLKNDAYSTIKILEND